MLSLPQTQQATIHWLEAGEVLVEAAYRNKMAALSDVALRFSAALEADGLELRFRRPHSPVASDNRFIYLVPSG